MSKTLLGALRMFLAHLLRDVSVLCQPRPQVIAAAANVGILSPAKAAELMNASAVTESARACSYFRREEVNSGLSVQVWLLTSTNVFY